MEGVHYFKITAPNNISREELGNVYSWSGIYGVFGATLSYHSFEERSMYVSFAPVGKAETIIGGKVCKNAEEALKGFKSGLKKRKLQFKEFNLENLLKNI